MYRKYNIEINKERVENEYWIDRLGKIHKFEGDLGLEYSSFHSEIASMLYPDSNRPTDILMDLGWIMVGSTVYVNPIIHGIPNQAQINKLDKIGLYEYLSFKHQGHYINFEKNQKLLI